MKWKYGYHAGELECEAVRQRQKNRMARGGDGVGGGGRSGKGGVNQTKTAKRKYLGTRNLSPRTRRISMNQDLYVAQC